MRATHLLIPGHIEPDGGVKCCICGCATTKERIGKDYFGDIFRDYREMQCRLSPYICGMCALSLKDVPGGVVHYIDGTEKTPKSDKRGLGWRFFSWVLVQGEAPIGATKAHTKELRAFLDNPPIEKPFAVIIAESGQKQLIYRLEAQTIEDRGAPYIVQYETEQVYIDGEFWEMLAIADKMALVLGKTKILDPPSYLALSKCMREYGQEFFYQYSFFTIRVDTAKARLCGFLAQSKGSSE